MRVVGERHGLRDTEQELRARKRSGASAKLRHLARKRLRGVVREAAVHRRKPREIVEVLALGLGEILRNREMRRRERAAVAQVERLLDDRVALPHPERDGERGYGRGNDAGAGAGKPSLRIRRRASKGAFTFMSLSK